MMLFLHIIALFAGNSLLLWILDSWNVLTIEHTFAVYFLVTFLLSIFHLILKPILKLLTFPLLLITFGLFTIVINMGMLWLTDYIVPGLSIHGLLALVYTTVLLSLFHTCLHSWFRHG